MDNRRVCVFKAVNRTICKFVTTIQYDSLKSMQTCDSHMLIQNYNIFSPDLPRDSLKTWGFPGRVCQTTGASLDFPCWSSSYSSAACAT